MNLFKDHILRKIVLSASLSKIGDILYYIALMTYASSLPNYKLAIALVTFSETLPSILSFFTGALADKTKNKINVIFLTTSIRIAIYILVGIAIGFDTGITILIIIVILNFISDFIGEYEDGLYIPILVSSIKDENKLESILGYYQAIINVANLLGQSLGAFLIIYLTYSYLSYLNSFTFLLSLIIVFLIKGTLKNNLNEYYDKNEISFEKKADLKGGKIDKTKQLFIDIFNTLKNLKNNQLIFSEIMIVSILNGLLAAISPLILIKITENKEMLIASTTSTTLSVIMVTLTIATLLGNTLGVSLLKNFNCLKIIQLIILFVGSLFTILLFDSLILILINLFAVMFFVAVVTPKLTAEIINNLDPEFLATNIGILNTILTIIGPIITMTISSIIIIVSLEIILLSIIGITLIMFLITIRITRKNNIIFSKTSEDIN
ncbi:hypothetical protein [Lysinibacillus capsici]|uniref:hypothetical protein n=1 Tax=Lysinibacillus capsici TaxID=2115968 RepID=UPI003081CA3C|nr:MFS transporter [Lysinibacillus capsici]